MAQNPNSATWRMSSFTDGMNCVEVADLGEQIAVRQSKDPDGPVLHFTRGEMLAFLRGAKAGEFDDLT
jgi:Domain of unknown function (DUF397)